MTELHSSEAVDVQVGTPIDLTVNGKPHQCVAGLSVLDFLTTLDLNPTAVVVELNRTILRRSDHEATMINDGDTIELVHFVGGG